MNTYHISRFEKSLVDFISEATARVYLQYFLSFVNDTGSSRSACTCRHHHGDWPRNHTLVRDSIKISFPEYKACTWLPAS